MFYHVNEARASPRVFVFLGKQPFKNFFLPQSRWSLVAERSQYHSGWLFHQNVGMDDRRCEDNALSCTSQLIQLFSCGVAEFCTLIVDNFLKTGTSPAHPLKFFYFIFLEARSSTTYLCSVESMFGKWYLQLSHDWENCVEFRVCWLRYLAEHCIRRKHFLKIINHRTLVHSNTFCMHAAPPSLHTNPRRNAFKYGKNSRF